MNYCILFLLIVSLQTAILHSIPYAQRGAFFQQELKKIQKEPANFVIFEIFERFEKDFSHFVNKDNLNLEQRHTAAFFKNKCAIKIDQYLVQVSKKTEVEIIKEALKLGRACIADMIQAKAEYECSLISNIDEETIKKIGIEVANEAYDEMHQEIKGSCSHLVDDIAFTQYLQKKLNNLQNK